MGRAFVVFVCRLDISLQHAARPPQTRDINQEHRQQDWRSSCGTARFFFPGRAIRGRTAEQRHRIMGRMKYLGKTMVSRRNVKIFQPVRDDLRRLRMFNGGSGENSGKMGSTNVFIILHINLLLRKIYGGHSEITILNVVQILGVHVIEKVFVFQKLINKMIL